MFVNMYRPYPDEVAAFGDHWCGPEAYMAWEKALIARYVSPDDSDGYTVEVYCTAAPARFYEVVALPSPNSCGEHRQGFGLGTGSGASSLAATLAEAISTGMLAPTGTP